MNVLYSSLVVCFCLMFPQPKYEYDLLLLRQTLFILSTHVILHYYRMFSIPFQCTLYLLYTSRRVFIWKINYCHIVISQVVICNAMSNTVSNYRGTLASNDKLSIKSNMNDWYIISGTLYLIMYDWYIISDNV